MLSLVLVFSAFQSIKANLDPELKENQSAIADISFDLLCCIGITFFKLAEMNVDAQAYTEVVRVK